MQTVPSCQTLYKNSFEYHTVTTAPPDFDECWSFHRCAVASTLAPLYLAIASSIANNSQLMQGLEEHYEAHGKCAGIHSVDG